MKELNSHFETKHLLADLKGRSVRGGAVTFAGQGIKFGLQVGSTMVLARLLTPQDFGLVAMVAAVTQFILVFKDLGLSMATVQKDDLTHPQVSTLFWVNIAISLILTLITVSLAPAVSWFFKEPRLTWITILSAAGFIIGGLSIQHQALMKRQMRFVALTSIDIGSMFVGVATGIVCAWQGLGYWALVFMQLATGLSNTLGVWVANNWRPGLPMRRTGVRPMLAFGGYMTGFNIVNSFSRNFDNILLGRQWGAQALGFYSRAYSLMLLPMGQITAPLTAVAIPALSRLQKEPELFRSYYLKAIMFIAYVSMPLIVAMGVLSNEIVDLVLGKQWKDAAPVFGILAIAGIWQPVGGTVGWIYASLNQARRMFLWSCISTPLVVLSFFVGLPWGPVGVAAGYSICICLIIVPSFAFALRHSPITMRDVFLNLYRPLAISIIAGVGMVLTRLYLVGFGPAVSITGTLAFGGCVCLLLVVTWSSAREDMINISNIAKLVIDKK